MPQRCAPAVAVVRRNFEERDGLLLGRNRVVSVTLRERRALLFQVENLLAHPSSGKKGFGIEGCVAICRLSLGCLEPGRCHNLIDCGSCGSRRIKRLHSLDRRGLATGWNAPGAHGIPPTGGARWVYYSASRTRRCRFLPIQHEEGRMGLTRVDKRSEERRVGKEC